MERTILHCDLNNFYASVACKLHPEFKELPLAVCGDVEARHGIVLAKNEVAKAFGVKTGEPIWQAKQKCANIVVIGTDFSSYRYYSKKAQEIYARYTDQIEPFGIDECWLDITGSLRLFGTAQEIAFKIKESIKAELGLTISVGISFNKVFAKIGSDMKKPDAITLIPRAQFKEILWNKPAEDMLCIGRATLSALHELGIYTIGDLANANPKTLKSRFGVIGEMLHTYANGKDNTPVSNINNYTPPKSIGRSVTTAQDMQTNQEVWRLFLHLTEDITRQLREHRLYAGGVQIHLRTNDLKVSEFSAMLPYPTQLTETFAKEGFKLFIQRFDWHLPLRAAGIRALHLTPNISGLQIGLFDNPVQDIKKEQLESRIFGLRQKYGDACISRASVTDLHFQRSESFVKFPHHKKS
ncbi:MAG: DNA polymerase IV [Clostridia bacterium]|nr:DNA polymerase IV [Clostridia bacterium]